MSKSTEYSQKRVWISNRNRQLEDAVESQLPDCISYLHVNVEPGSNPDADALAKVIQDVIMWREKVYPEVERIRKGEVTESRVDCPYCGGIIVIARKDRTYIYEKCNNCGKESKTYAPLR